MANFLKRNEHKFTQAQIQNFILIKSFAEGYYSNSTHIGILFIPKGMISEEILKTITFSIENLDGKNSFVDASIKVIKSDQAVFNLKYSIDNQLLDAVLDKVHHIKSDIKRMKELSDKHSYLNNIIDPNNQYKNYDIDDEELRNYQTLVIEYLKNITLDDNETILLNEINNTKNKLKELIDIATPNLINYLEIN